MGDHSFHANRRHTPRLALVVIRSLARGVALLLLLPHPAPCPAQAPSSPFAFSDFLLVPLRVHLLSSEAAPDFHTTLTAEDMDRILDKMNRIWAQAGIHFHLESLVREEAANPVLESEFKETKKLHLLLKLRPEATRDPRMLHLYYINRMHVNGVYLGAAMFVKDTASLRPVPGGIDEPIPRVSSHEIGHAFSLGHRQAVTNLMASGTTGTTFNDEEIAKARANAMQRDWIIPAPEVLRQANALVAANKPAEARRLYHRLAGLPPREDAEKN